MDRMRQQKHDSIGSYGSNGNADEHRYAYGNHNARNADGHPDGNGDANGHEYPDGHGDDYARDNRDATSGPNTG